MNLSGRIEHYYETLHTQATLGTHRRVAQQQRHRTNQVRLQRLRRRPRSTHRQQVTRRQHLRRRRERVIRPPETTRADTQPTPLAMPVRTVGLCRIVTVAETNRHNTHTGIPAVTHTRATVPVKSRSRCGTSHYDKCYTGNKLSETGCQATQGHQGHHSLLGSDQVPQVGRNPKAGIRQNHCAATQMGQPGNRPRA